jgi:hypothetical protein
MASLNPQTTRLVPFGGIDNTGGDEALAPAGDDPRTFVRDAVNVDFTPEARASVRKSFVKMSDTPYKNLWHCPLFGDTFASLGEDWGRIDPETWDFLPLFEMGEGTMYGLVLNHRALIAGPNGIAEFNGTVARRLTLECPPRPVLTAASEGSLVAGRYAAAVSWLRDGQESPCSSSAFVDTGGESITVTPPLCLDTTVTGWRLYLTAPNGGELLKHGDYPPGEAVTIPRIETLGGPAPFPNTVPMPTGKYLSYWRGRLLTASRNVVRFSESLAFHIHDARFGFFLMPQRVTFLAPVEGGIFVGQVDHVAFLRGTSPQEMESARLAARPPVPGSVVYLEAEDSRFGTNGAAVPVWLAENGYVAGMPDGSLVEMHKGRLSGIAAESGASAVVEGRVVTALA